MARFQVHYGDVHPDASHSYVVWDSIARRIIYSSDSKSACIAESERRNGWPVTGDESAYSRHEKE